MGLETISGAQSCNRRFAGILHVTAMGVFVRGSPPRAYELLSSARRRTVRYRHQAEARHRTPAAARVERKPPFSRLGASSGCHASVIAAPAVPHRLGDAGSTLARPCSTPAPSSCHQPSILACQPMMRASASLCGSGRPHPSAERRDEVLNYCPHAPRQGDRRGIQRGTFARKASYSAPNLCCSVRSSYRMTYAWQASQNSAA